MKRFFFQFPKVSLSRFYVITFITKCTIQSIPNFKFLAAILCTYWNIKLANSFLCSFDWISFHNIFCRLCHSAKKTFPEKNWERCNFLFPYYYNLHIFGLKNVFVQFSKIVLLRGRIFRSLKSIFKRFLFAIIWYFGNNNRQHP